MSKLKHILCGVAWSLVVACNAMPESDVVSTQHASVNAKAQVPGGAKLPSHVEKKEVVKPLFEPPKIPRRYKPPPLPPSSPPVKKEARWSYDHKACVKGLQKVLIERELGTVGADREGGLGIMMTPLMPYAKALASPPTTELGSVIVEGGDGCRYYYPEVAYRFQRATKPKYTKGFIRYEREPTWLGQYKASATTNATGKMKVAAMYRGDVIVYEIDHNPGEEGSDIKSDRYAVRRAIEACFSKEKLP